MVPTIGRIVWLYPEKHCNIHVGLAGYIAGMVQEVWKTPTGYQVTVVGTDLSCRPFVAHDVPLYDPEQVPEVSMIYNYATWMPYQVAQAAKEQVK